CFLYQSEELTRLFQKCRTSGSVFITLKKYDGRTKPVPRKGHAESFEPADNKCLLRATDGKKKISTVVSSKEVNKFQMVSFVCLLSSFSVGTGEWSVRKHWTAVNRLIKS
uniref:Signal recognition particle 14 kDa protein n=1 Tax=Athene cunicularia TaxID=194338 RepID=A0A663MLF1_ATHCN